MMDNSTYKKIESFLDKYNQDVGPDYGLYKGKFGISSCYILLSQYYNKTRNRNIGLSLLEEVKANIESIDEIGPDGILGIGLGFNILSLNKIIEIEIDDFLYEFDDFFYKMVTLKNSSDLSFEKGILGMAQYFYLRMLTQNKFKLEYRFILHHECLILLTVEFKKFLIGEKGLLALSSTKLTKEQALQISQCFILLYRIWKLKLNIDLLADLLRTISGYIEKEFSSLENPDKQLILLYSYLLVGLGINDTSMIRNSSLWFWNIENKVTLSSFNILLLSRIRNSLKYPLVPFPMKLEHLFDVFVSLDRKEESIENDPTVMDGLNLWGVY